MARARNIKPGFFKNEDLGTADPFVALLFAGLWTLADKAGILEDRPLRIKAELFPYRDAFDINGYLTVLTQFKLIHRYIVDGVAYIQVAKFEEHQNPHHTEKVSIFPSYSDSCKITVKDTLINGDTPADSLIPDSLNTDSLIPDVAPAEKQAAAKPKNELAAKTWAAYSPAYHGRYGTDPVRNQIVNSQVVNFCKRIGDESPQVAEFFLSLETKFYKDQMHSFGILLRDAEKLRTQWATGYKPESNLTNFQTKGERIAANNARAAQEFLNESTEKTIEGEIIHD